MTENSPTPPFVVEKECLRLGLRARAILFRDVKIKSGTPALRESIRTAARAVQKQFASAAEIRALPEFVKLYEIFRTVGVKPREHPPSTDSLLRFALKRGDLPAINNLVDSYNLVSIQSHLSLGAHDIDLVTPPVRLQRFPQATTFVPLGNSDGQTVGVGEFGYVDAQDRVLCRLDARQANFSKVSETTRNVLLIVEGTVAHEANVLTAAREDVERRVLEQCGGAVEWRSTDEQPDIL